jgi:hypothetical protein
MKHNNVRQMGISYSEDLFCPHDPEQHPGQFPFFFQMDR